MIERGLGVEYNESRSRLLPKRFIDTARSVHYDLPHHFDEHPTVF